jgi:hypothetical protein
VFIVDFENLSCHRFEKYFAVLYSGHKPQATNSDLKAIVCVQPWFNHFYLPSHTMAFQSSANDPIHAFMQRLSRSGPNNHVNDTDDTGSIMEDNDSQLGDRSGDEGGGGMPEEAIDLELDSVGSSITARLLQSSVNS